MSASQAMSPLDLAVLLVIAAICGAIARAIAGGTGGGFLVSVLLGFLGAVVGTRLARMLRLPELLQVEIGRQPFPVVWSILGALVLVALAHVLMRPAPRWR